MNSRPIFSYLLPILILSSVVSGRCQTATPPFNPAVPETHAPAQPLTKLPFRLRWGYLVIVEGSIGHLQKLNFLVDTGASPSVIDQKISHDLGLTEQRARVTLSTKSVQTHLVVLPSLLLGPPSCGVPAGSDTRSLVFSKRYRHQRRCDCGSGRPQEK